MAYELKLEERIDRTIDDLIFNDLLTTGIDLAFSLSYE